MGARLWLWLGTIVDGLLFPLGAYMAIGAVDLARANSDSGAAVGIAFLFLALPVFALACPMTAWRSHARGRSRHAAGMMLAPVVYAAFLILLVVLG